MKNKIHDLVGVPLPTSHKLFNEDKKLLKNIEKVEGYIELREDISEVKEALNTLKKSLNVDFKEMSNVLGAYSFHLPNIIITYIVITYAKSFVSSTGRPNLKNVENDIFKNNLDRHQEIILLRHKFFAHQEYEANRHQLFCFQNTPAIGKVKMNPNGQTIRIQMGSLDVSIIKFCVEETLSYLNMCINEICTVIENSLSEEQINLINTSHKEDLFSGYWKENPEHKIDPLISRKKENK